MFEKEKRILSRRRFQLRFRTECKKKQTPLFYVSTFNMSSSGSEQILIIFIFSQSRFSEFKIEPATL